MVTLNAAFLRAQFQDSAITATNAEVVLDGAINMLNVYDAGLSNLLGTAGTKSGTYTSKEVGAIMAVAQQIYKLHFKSASGATTTVSTVGLTYSSDNQLLSFARQMANQLKSGAIYRT